MKFVSLLLLVFVSAFCSYAQQTTITVSVPVSKKTTSAMLFVPNEVETYRHAWSDWFWNIDTPLLAGKATFSFEVNTSVYMRLSVKGLPQATLFVMPGDHLSVIWQDTGSKKGYIVTGRGSNNNQDVKERLAFNTDLYEKDTLPGRILADLRAAYSKDSAALRSYFAKHRPSLSYVNARKADLAYFIPDVFCDYLGNHKFYLRDLPNYPTLKPVWDRALDSIMKRTTMTDYFALVSPHYTHFLTTYLLRYKEELWDQMSTDPEEFRKDWCYDEHDSGKALLADMENLLTEKIIKRSFNGSVKEFAYVHMMHEAVGEKEDNLVKIYNNFTANWPVSTYQPFLEPRLAPIREKFRRWYNEKMIIVPNSTSYKTFGELKQLVKGKTVLLDMWGTWCGPCRKELDQHSQALKDYFKGKGVVFLYVANYDLGNETRWKDLIPYYNLEGTHILASQELTADINKVTKMSGYPSYIIIKKDGSFELSQAGYPMNRAKLIKQIEAAL
ncbi:TlpA disulfide reductase family protein [Paraflavitalea sp. CAU 1676]|uniref:TlpA family protein disulfide reductase n=1 Tax=Paraflavitalea sp. CAU 1676 TaxID=3032598 RepID=UPI0023DA8C81|nr:TlpA disulfide reductase family protein [Paraflavitalea sp. CAU 1676]MDF2193514.1 TlpA disulfide reductase family protein [Paraflavitalea sp. CAU 1676]